MLNDRQERLLATLAERQDWMKSRELALLLRVSDRTIRSDVEAVNRHCGPGTIESNVRQGYRAEAKNAKPAGGGGIPQTPGARCIYIIRRMLFEVKELNLVELQERMYVSGYSIDKDLKNIRKMLEPYPGLKLVRTKECIRLEGREAEKRRFYKDLLVAEVRENFLNLNQLAGLYKDFDLIEIRDIFVSVLEEYDYSINEALFPMLILHAGTDIERMLHSDYVGCSDSDEKLDETIEYEIARTFFERVSARLHLTVKEGERERLALVIMGKRASSYTSDHVNYKGRWYNTQKLAEQALEQLHATLGVDLREDDDLIAGLKMHLHGLIDRVKSHIRQDNLFLDEIKRKYPMVFEMAICITQYLEHCLGVEIVDAESGFIALHLGAASERMNARRTYRAAAVLPYNQSFSDMCLKKIGDMFHERMEIVKVLHLFEADEIRKLEPDLILTAMPLNHDLDVMTVPINLFVDPETESGILQALSRLDKKRFQLEFASHVGMLIRREYYYQKLDCAGPEEVICRLCADLERDGIVKPEFKDVVLKRESMSPTSFINAFAIPHAFGVCASRSTIAVAQLKAPVRWGSFDVKLVMLFAVEEGDQRMIKMFFDWISSVVNSPDRLAGLCVPCDYDQFLEHMMD